MFVTTLQAALTVTVPIFAVMLLGVWLRRKRWIDDAFVETGSKLVFRYALPTVLFLSISQANFDQAFNAQLIGTGLVGTLVAWLVLEALVSRFIQPRSDRGVVVQGSFRSNMGIIGLAYCANAYGQTGLVSASMYLALVTILYNVLSVISLNRWAAAETQWRKIGHGVVTNPLIVAICSAIPFSLFQWPIPSIAVVTLEYVAQLTLPLALLCTGASSVFLAYAPARAMR